VFATVAGPAGRPASGKRRALPAAAGGAGRGAP